MNTFNKYVLQAFYVLGFPIERVSRVSRASERDWASNKMYISSK